MQLFYRGHPIPRGRGSHGGFPWDIKPRSHRPLSEGRLMASSVLRRGSALYALEEGGREASRTNILTSRPPSSKLPWDLTWKRLAAPSLSSTTSTSPQIERWHWSLSAARTPLRGHPPLIYHDLQSSILSSTRRRRAWPSQPMTTRKLPSLPRPSPSPPFLRP
jgi:hypothetical protein